MGQVRQIVRILAAFLCKPRHHQYLQHLMFRSISIPQIITQSMVLGKWRKSPKHMLYENTPIAQKQPQVTILFGAVGMDDDQWKER